MSSSNTTSHPPTEATLTQLWELLGSIRFGMFTARGPDGLYSRPLTTQNGKSARGRELYFFVEVDSEVAHDAAADPVVNVAYADPDQDRYISISGHARLVDDRALVEKLFTPMAKSWFPGGPQDPKLQLLVVDMHGAEYWDVKDSKVTQLFKMAKAVATGTPPQDMGEHREVKLS